MTAEIDGTGLTIEITLKNSNSEMDRKVYEFIRTIRNNCSYLVVSDSSRLPGHSYCSRGYKRPVQETTC
ncbi:MAG: hypothetical protein LBS91_03415 [Clostridiales Family XIII bacterium]|jgi:hypothetical protein|nr:hypothetical protein [Clostridiales Family XIII bacterium]